jgi:hypothetical protein
MPAKAGARGRGQGGQQSPGLCKSNLPSTHVSRELYAGGPVPHVYTIHQTILCLALAHVNIVLCLLLHLLPHLLCPPRSVLPPLLP